MRNSRKIKWKVLENAEQPIEFQPETILRAWEKLPTLRQEEHFQTWVVRILINQCYSIGRRLGRTVPLEDAPPPEATPPSVRPLRDAVLALPDKYRAAVVLHYIEGYSVEETAGLLGVPAGTVKTRLYRARERLKRELEEAQSI